MKDQKCEISKSTMTSNNKIVWMEALRIVSAFGIILAHIASNIVWDYPTDQGYWKVASVYHTLPRFGVCCFVMISGAIFLDPNREFTAKKLWGKYIKRIITIFALWSVVYIIAWFNDNYGATFKESGWGAIKNDVIREFFQGHFHMWYLFLAVSLYIATPLLKEIVKNKKATEYIIVLGIIFCFVPTMLQRCSVISEIKDVYLKGATVLYFSNGYLVYFLLGHYLSTYEIPKKTRNVIYTLGILGLIYAIIFGIVFSVKDGELVEVAYDNASLNILFYSVATFVFFKYRQSKFIERHAKLICTVSSCTLGIYLMHVLFTHRLTVPFVELLGLNNIWLSLPLLTLFVFTVSFAITYLLRKIPFMKKYFI